MIDNRSKNGGIIFSFLIEFLNIFFGLSLVVIIGLTPVYKKFKGKQLCLALKNE